VVDAKTRRIVKISFTNPYVRRLLVELPTVSLSLGVVVSIFIGYRAWRQVNTGFTSETMGAIANAVLIIVLGYIYKKVAVLLVNWENHRFAYEWEDSLIVKNFAF